GAALGLRRVAGRAALEAHGALSRQAREVGVARPLVIAGRACLSDRRALAVAAIQPADARGVGVARGALLGDRIAAHTADAAACVAACAALALGQDETRRAVRLLAFGRADLRHLDLLVIDELFARGNVERLRACVDVVDRRAGARTEVR